MSKFPKLDEYWLQQDHECGPHYYDKAGVPISLGEWAELMEDPAYRRIAWTELGAAAVSTVWLGLDHNYGDGPPLIFETMIFGPGETAELEERYSTLEEALAGHERVTALVQQQAVIRSSPSPL